MKSIFAYFFSILLLTTSLCASAQNGELSLNGIASFEQLRKEYYIGALYLGWPGHDPAAIANMPGKKRLQLNITADRWPSLRFAQMWNQAITINNPSAFINANALDILAFTSLPKGDLVEGDHLVIELNNTSTLVTLNGIPALRTNSPALFTMLLNAWIGQRPPTSEFKRDILELPKDKTGTDLVARFNSVNPNDARKKTVAGWGFKVEPEAGAALATAAPAAATTAVNVAASKKPEPTEAKAPEPKPVAEAKPVEPKPTATPVATPTPAPVEVAKAAPAPAALVQPDAATIAAKAAHEKEQQALYGEYAGGIRGKVLRNIEYPRRAAKESIEGLVMVRIKVDRSGSLNSVEIAQSADDLLDSEAERAVKRSAPFPKAPDALEGAVTELIVPIVFKLSQ